MNNREVDRGKGCTFTMHHDFGQRHEHYSSRDYGSDIINNALSTLIVGVG